MKKIAQLMGLGLFALALSSCGCCANEKTVLERATAQGGTGETHIGTIPTMKVLAP